VVHEIDPGKVYRIFDFKIDYEDPALEVKYDFYYPADKNIGPGKVFSRTLLEGVRSRMARNFHNLGYYRFSKSHIHFIADTLAGNQLVDLTMVIKNPEKGRKHSLVKIRNVFVDVDFNPSAVLAEYDTLELQPNFYALVHGDPFINPEVLRKQIKIKPQDYVVLKKTESTYKNITKLGVYQTISIRFPKVENNENLVDCRITLSRMPQYSISAETRLESRVSEWKDQDLPGSNFGINGRVSLDNNNIFRGGENLRLSLGGGLEPFLITDSLSNANNKLLNTFEFGPLVKLTVPRFVFPTFWNLFSIDNSAITEFTASYNILSNIDLKRQELKLGYRYAWKETEEKRHTISPITISTIKVNPSATLSSRLATIKDPFVTNTYQNNLIISSSYSYSLNKKKRKGGQFLYAEIEGAGNLLEQLSGKMGLREDESGQHLIWNIPFAQFVKTDMDFRLYKNIGQKSQIATRLFTGIGLPFGEVPVLPFQKSYYGGGANGIRAWKARTLGPGLYADTSSFGGNFDRIGDIHLEANVEYRFPLMGFLKGALFLDAGNVWNISPIESRPDGQISPEFYNAIALGGGFGARLDFDFFILRLDFGFRLRDPGLVAGERWFYEDKTQFNESVENYNDINSSSLGGYNRHRYNISFGIGYPF